MESALDDSQRYEILSPENIEELKKRLSIVSSRIDSTKRKLVLETKLRDAAQSINRLQPPKTRENSIDSQSNSPRKHRRSAFGSKGSANDLLGRSDIELRESARKCEELAQELWQLEKQEQDLQKRLLEHTAGVLQLTHRGYIKETPFDSTENGNRVSDGIHGLDDAGDFSDRSHYRPYSGSEEYAVDYLNGPGVPSKTQFAHQAQMIVDVERRVEDLNARLRDLILQLKPRKEELPQPPRELNEDPSNPGGILWEQIDFLDKCLDVIGDLQAHAGKDSENSNAIVEERLETLNSQLHDIMTRSNPSQTSKYKPPPEISGQGLQDQLEYLEGGLDAVDRRTKQLREAVESSSEMLAKYDKRAERYQSVIGELWDILTAAEVDARQQGQKEDSSNATEQDFSLQIFSTKVKALQSLVKELQEQKDVLSRQIQQQRSVSEKSDSEKDARLQGRTEELERARKQLGNIEREAKSHRDELILVVAELEAARHAMTSRDQQKALEDNEMLNTEKQARKEVEDHMFAELSAKQESISQLELQLQKLRDDASKPDWQGKLSTAEVKLQRLTAQLEEAKESSAVMEVNALTLKSDLEEKSKGVILMQNEIRERDSEIAQLQTELTVSKAELDSAYGTRAQRAADVAADPSLHNEIDSLTERNMSLMEEIAALKTAQSSTSKSNIELTARVKTLQRELGETLSDYEAMTKASVEFEKEREQLENAVDALRDRVEDLDSQLTDEKVQMLGSRSRGARESIAGGSTSTMVLKNEFKKMMRETRAEYAKTLRVSLAAVYQR